MSFYVILGETYHINHLADESMTKEPLKGDF
jgi:hypothetical protein